jgi:hypothetical protein
MTFLDRTTQAKERLMHRNRKRLRLLAATAGACALAIPAAAGAATTTPFQGTLLVHWPLPATQPFPCTGPPICATGTLQGLGPVEITIDDDQFTPIPDSDCFAIQRSETITVLDASGTIALRDTGTGCPPGSSQSGPHSNSYGNPFIAQLSFTIDGTDSTGAYQGAAGSGTERWEFAGATGTWNLTGTLATP